MSRLLAAVAVPALAILAGVSTVPAEAAAPARSGVIVFASDRGPLLFGEIYSADARTGRVRRVTSNRRIELLPVLSPRGDRLAYVGRDGVYTAHADGTRPRRVAAAAEAWARVSALEWSPDARQLAYVVERRAAGERVTLAVAPADGRQTQAVVARSSPDSGAIGGPSWSADGRSLVYRRDEGDTAMIEVVDVRTRRARTVAGPGWYPAWSPDGRRIAYSTAAGVMLVAPAGGPPRRLTGPLQGAISWAPDSRRLAVGSNVVDVRTRSVRRLFGVPGGVPAWSPDGSRVALVSPGRSRYTASVPAPPWIRIRAVDGPSARPVARVSPPLSERDNSDDGLLRAPAITRVSWARDGSRVFYGLRWSENAPSDLYAVRPEGGAPQRLTGSRYDFRDPRWSPDGRRVAAACWEGAGELLGTHRICILDGRGALLRLLDNWPEDLVSGLAWSPDGTELTFVSGAAVHPVIHSVTFDSRALPGARALARGLAPAWSPDGGRVAYLERSGGGWALRLLDRDAGTTRTLATLGAFGGAPSWSPDGSRVAYADGGSLFTVPVEEAAPQPAPLFGEGWLPGLPKSSLTWSPDGTRVLFGAGRGLAAARADGSGGAILTPARGPGSDSSPDWQPLCTHYGTDRADRLRGTAAADLLCGLEGDDTIEAGAGDDTVLGGFGHDRLDGGPGRDRLFGGFGNDVTLAADGERDVVRCGPGFDTVVADRIDVVASDCEVVERR